MVDLSRPWPQESAKRPALTQASDLVELILRAHGAGDAGAARSGLTTAASVLHAPGASFPPGPVTLGLLGFVLDALVRLEWAPDPRAAAGYADDLTIVGLLAGVPVLRARGLTLSAAIAGVRGDLAWAESELGAAIASFDVAGDSAAAAFLRHHRTALSDGPGWSLANALSWPPSPWRAGGAVPQTHLPAPSVPAALAAPLPVPSVAGLMEEGFFGRDPDPRVQLDDAPGAGSPAPDTHPADVLRTPQWDAPEDGDDGFAAGRHAATGSSYGSPADAGERWRRVLEDADVALSQSRLADADDAYGKLLQAWRDGDRDGIDAEDVARAQVQRGRVLLGYAGEDDAAAERAVGVIGEALADVRSPDVTAELARAAAHDIALQPGAAGDRVNWKVTLLLTAAREWTRAGHVDLALACRLEAAQAKAMQRNRMGYQAAHEDFVEIAQAAWQAQELPMYVRAKYHQAMSTRFFLNRPGDAIDMINQVFAQPFYDPGTREERQLDAQLKLEKARSMLQGGFAPQNEEDDPAVLIGGVLNYATANGDDRLASNARRLSGQL